MLDPYLQFIPKDIVQKKFAFFEHVHNSHLINIAIVAAMKLICNGFESVHLA